MAWEKSEKLVSVGRLVKQPPFRENLISISFKGPIFSLLKANTIRQIKKSFDPKN